MKKKVSFRYISAVPTEEIELDDNERIYEVTAKGRNTVGGTRFTAIVIKETLARDE